MDQEFVRGVNVDTLLIEHLPFLNYHTGLYCRFDTNTPTTFLKKAYRPHRYCYHGVCMYHMFLPPCFMPLHSSLFLSWSLPLGCAPQFNPNL